jgi:hypothetical protein
VRARAEKVKRAKKVEADGNDDDRANKKEDSVNNRNIPRMSVSSKRTA